MYETTSSPPPWGGREIIRKPLPTGHFKNPELTVNLDFLKWPLAAGKRQNPTAPLVPTWGGREIIRKPLPTGHFKKSRTYSGSGFIKVASGSGKTTKSELPPRLEDHTLKVVSVELVVHVGVDNRPARHDEIAFPIYCKEPAVTQVP